MTGAEFKALRVKFGVGQQRFADFVGVNVSTVRRWETGDQPLPKWAAIIMRNYAEGKLALDDPGE
jgi:DNA-binding transcriptional regulator YiaG